MDMDNFKKEIKKELREHIDMYMIAFRKQAIILMAKFYIPVFLFSAISLL